jgi:hypothetical protein
MRNLRPRPLAAALLCFWSAMPQWAASAAEAGRGEPPDLSGVWSGIYTSPGHDGWRVEDFSCPVGCLSATYDYLRGLLKDPHYRDVPFAALETRAQAETQPLVALLTPEGQAGRRAFERGDDPSIRCEPKGVARQVLNPLPLEIAQHANHVTLRYEQWQALRTVALDREPRTATATSLLGTSVGHYDGAALVIETTAISANILTVDGIPHSDNLRTVERYVLADGGRRLELELTLHDPVMLTQPIVMTKAWLRTPEETILGEKCEVVSGQP